VDDVGTLPLLPVRSLDAVTTPVLAAGGIRDVPRVAAVVTAGASRRLGGHRPPFLTCTEASTSPGARGRLIAATDTDTVYTRVFDIGARAGWPREFGERALRNQFHGPLAGPRGGPHDDAAPPESDPARGGGVLRHGLPRRPDRASRSCMRTDRCRRSSRARPSRRPAPVAQPQASGTFRPKRDSGRSPLRFMGRNSGPDLHGYGVSRFFAWQQPIRLRTRGRLRRPGKTRASSARSGFGLRDAPTTSSLGRVQGVEQPSIHVNQLAARRSAATPVPISVELDKLGLPHVEISISQYGIGP